MKLSDMRNLSADPSSSPSVEGRFKGLTDEEVSEMREKHGANILTPPKEEPPWRLFLRKFTDPLIVILLITGLLSVIICLYEYLALDESWKVFFDPTGIFIAVFLATGIAFVYEQKAGNEYRSLNQIDDEEKVRVIRYSGAMMIAKKDIVVGDIVLLETGDEVPADGELLDAVSLVVDESRLTGEPSCRKSVGGVDLKKGAYPVNHVMRGSKVMEGHGAMRVFAVGDKTEDGKVYESVHIDNKERTPFNEQLDRMAAIITVSSYIIAALVIIAKLVVYFHAHWLSFLFVVPTALFFGLVIKKFSVWAAWKNIISVIAYFALLTACLLYVHDALLPGENISFLLTYTLGTLMIAATLIVVAVPEGLPMAITVSLAYSMRRMLKTNNLVRKLHACETMGAATVICTDKTGTLTENEMRVAATLFMDIKGQLLASPKLPDGRQRRLIEENIALNSTAALDLSERNNPRPLGNPTEGALLKWLYGMGVDYRKIRLENNLLAQLPFTTEKKYMATTVRRGESGRRIMFVKGAPEIVRAMCHGGGGEAIDLWLRNYQGKAMRTLAFAYKILGEGEEEYLDGEIAAHNLIFLGVVAISDPVRADVPESIKEVLDAGINIKIITGDSLGTACEIGRQVGLLTDGDTARSVITGDELSLLSDEELLRRIDDLKIIARARPMDKKRLVEILQKKSQVVAVTGDGTNDAPALKAAHVGLSMGSGSKVAKEASDITIIDNSFSSICRAVMWGRSLYQNIQRFLLFQLTVNVAACLLVLAGSFLGRDNPLTVTQLLWINLIMDTFGAVALSSLPPNKCLMRDKPRDRKAFFITSWMGKNIIGVGGIFFLLLIAMVYACEHAEISSMSDFARLSLDGSGSLSPYEQTLIFSLFVWFHLWYIFSARAFGTDRSVFELPYSRGFWIIVAIIVIGQVIIVEVLYNFFNVVPMNIADWVIIVALSSLVIWVRECWLIVRRLYTGARYRRIPA